MRLLTNFGFLLGVGLLLLLQYYWVKFIYWLRDKNTVIGNTIIYLAGAFTIVLVCYIFCKILEGVK